MPHNKTQAIVGLLSTSSLAEAAATAGVAERTLRRWLAEDGEFLAAYREARRMAVEHAVSNLQAATGEAVSTLERNLECGKPATEVRAALGILEHSLSALAWQDVEGRLAALERSWAQNKRNGSRH